MIVISLKYELGKANECYILTAIVNKIPFTVAPIK